MTSAFSLMLVQAVQDYIAFFIDCNAACCVLDI